MVAFAVLVHILKLHLFSAQRCHPVEGFQNRATVVSPSSNVVHFAASRIFREGVNEPGNVEGMDVVPHLLSFVPENLVGSAFDIAFDQVTEKSVQLDAAMIWAGQTAAP